MKNNIIPCVNKLVLQLFFMGIRWDKITMCGLDYLCSECSTQLSKFEINLNKQFPIGKLYCSFCQSKKEREIIKQLCDSEMEIRENEKY